MTQIGRIVFAWHVVIDGNEMNLCASCVCKRRKERVVVCFQFDAAVLVQFGELAAIADRLGCVQWFVYYQGVTWKVSAWRVLWLSHNALAR